MNQSFSKIWGVIIVFILLIGVSGGILAWNYWQTPKEPKKETMPPKLPELPEKEKEVKVPIALAHEFAVFEEIPVNITPKISPYSIDSDLANITNKDEFEFSSEAKELLVKNAFAVVPSDYDEFFSLYEENRYAKTPSFITVDSVLHNYHLAFDHLLRTLEKEKLYPELKTLSSKMLEASMGQYETLKGTDWENAAKRHMAFFTVAGKLAGLDIEVPPVVKNEVEEELDLIEKHAGIKVSPIMNIGRDPKKEVWIDTPQGFQPLEAFKEDYSQYVPRGHYTRSEDLKKYFKTMMWYGRMTFRIKSEDETKSAVLATIALKESRESYESWEKIYEPTVFFVGKSDDITFYDYWNLLKSTYGNEQINISLLKDNEEKFSSFLNEAKKLSPPSINSMPIFEAGFQQDREEEIKGFRFMGQRFTIDASIFQRLVYREVGDKTKSCGNYDPLQASCLAGARCLPKGLDIPAAMGSKEAYNILDFQGETDYACYLENMDKMKDYISSLDTDIWTQNLYWSWLYSLKPLTEEKPEGYPTFMRNPSWVRKELNSFLGSWTELKHDTILYAKQVYAEMGAGPMEEVDDRGYVEPNPHLYSRLASLIKMTKEGLQIRELLSKGREDLLNKMEELVLSLKTISEKELNNIPLTDEEHKLIRTYGGSLEHFWIEVNKDLGIESKSQLSDEPAPIIADVATDPNGICLEEGTGKIFEIYAIVPIDEKLRIAKGGVYSYYEFAQPINNRLTDEKWREMLDEGKAPLLPEWTNEFISK